MNLPAVILFICFSTAYGLQCKKGGHGLNPKDGGKFSVPIETKECPKTERAPLCVRIEGIYSGKSSGETIFYVCPDQANPPCLEDGKCNDTDKKEGDFDVKERVCCSSDVDFKNAPSLFPDGKEPSPSNDSPTPSPSDNPSQSDQPPASSPPDSTPSSAVSSPALLATGIALLGLTF